MFHISQIFLNKTKTRENLQRKKATVCDREDTKVMVMAQHHFVHKIALPLACSEKSTLLPIYLNVKPQHKTHRKTGKNK